MVIPLWVVMVVFLAINCETCLAKVYLIVIVTVMTA